MKLFRLKLKFFIISSDAFSGFDVGEFNKNKITIIYYYSVHFYELSVYEFIRINSKSICFMCMNLFKLKLKQMIYFN